MEETSFFAKMNELSTLIEELGLTRRTLADRNGVSLKTVNSWCNDKTKPPEMVLDYLRLRVWINTFIGGVK